MGIWLTAFALVFNGFATGYAWVDAPDLPAAVAHDHRGGAGAAGHHDHSGDRIAIVADSGLTYGSMLDHLKCCGRCNVNVVSLLPRAVAIPATFSFATLSFRTTQDHLVGHLVVLEPDIPKTIV
jgi:hypothetical protein